MFSSQPMKQVYEYALMVWTGMQYECYAVYQCKQDAVYVMDTELVDAHCYIAKVLV